jgi:hypothetical protein
MIYSFKSFEVIKVWLNFSQYEIQICQMTSDGKMTNTKVVDHYYTKSFRWHLGLINRGGQTWNLPRLIVAVAGRPGICHG